MASATLREIFSNAPHTTPATKTVVVDEFGWMDEDPDLAPFLSAKTAWKPRKEVPLDAFA